MPGRQIAPAVVFGKIEQHTVQEIAHAATCDGLATSEIMSLANLGTFGKHPANCHRDMLRHLQTKLQRSQHGGLKDSPSLQIRVQALDAKEEDPKTSVDCSIVLPHLLIWQFFETYEKLCPHLFGLGKLDDFWGRIKKDDPRIWGMGLKESQKDRLVPLWLHGDGVEFSTDSLLTFSFGPTLFSPGGLQESHKEERAGHCMETSWLIAAWPKAATAKETWGSIYEVITWSFTCLWQGKHPHTNWKGEALPSKLQRLAGKPIADGYRFWVFNYLGDLDYYSNTLGFPHWGRHDFCWLCDCHRQDDSKSPWDFTEKPGWKLKPYKDLKESPCTSHPLFKIPGGLPEYRICLDALHTLDLGLSARLAGSILHCWAFPPGATKSAGACNIAKIWASIKEAYEALKIKEKFNNMTVSMFCNAEKPFASVPILKGHAGEIRHFLFALSWVAWKKAHESEMHNHMAESLAHLCEFYSLLKEQDFFMEEEAWKKAHKAMRGCLIHVAWLNRSCKDEYRFRVTPKMHFALHLAWSCRWQNASTCWTYKQESFMGYVSNLAHSCSHGTRACRLSSSLISKYLLALQLKINNLI